LFDELDSVEERVKIKFKPVSFTETLVSDIATNLTRFSKSRKRSEFA
jgi:hypothetical protein